MKIKILMAIMLTLITLTMMGQKNDLISLHINFGSVEAKEAALNEIRGDFYKKYNIFPTEILDKKGKIIQLKDVEFEKICETQHTTEEVLCMDYNCPWYKTKFNDFDIIAPMVDYKRPMCGCDSITKAKVTYIIPLCYKITLTVQGKDKFFKIYKLTQTYYVETRYSVVSNNRDFLPKKTINIEPIEIIENNMVGKSFYKISPVLSEHLYDSKRGIKFYYLDKTLDKLNLKYKVNYISILKNRKL